MTQAFALINGTTLQRFLSARDNRIDAVIAEKDSPAGQIESLFWTALTRPPSVGEGEPLTALVSAAGDRRAALEDVLWGLLNAKEFVLRK